MRYKHPNSVSSGLRRNDAPQPTPLAECSRFKNPRTIRRKWPNTELQHHYVLSYQIIISLQWSIFFSVPKKVGWLRKRDHQATSGWLPRNWDYLSLKGSKVWHTINSEMMWYGLQLDCFLLSAWIWHMCH